MLKRFLPSDTSNDLGQLLNNFTVRYREAKNKREQVNLLSLLPAEWSYEKMKKQLGTNIPLVSRYLWSKSRELLENSGPMPGIRPKVKYN